MTAFVPDACQTVRRNLEAFLLRELRGAERDAVRQHLARCAACADEAVAVEHVLARVCSLGRLSGSRAPVVHPGWRAAAVAAAVIIAIVGFEALSPVAAEPGRVGGATPIVARMAAPVCVDWLLGVQHPDGSWAEPLVEDGAVYSVGITALAAASLLDSSSERNGSEELAAWRACAFVASQIRADGSFEGSGDAGPAMRVQVQAAGAAALVRAARRWPETFASPARSALSTLASWQRADGAFVPMDAAVDGNVAAVLAWKALSDGAANAVALPGLDRAALRAARRLNLADPFRPPSELLRSAL